MGILKKVQGFAASPFSGYALIALLFAAGGAAYWFWTELKEFGSLEVIAEQQQNDITSLKNEVSYLQGKADLKNDINRQLGDSRRSIDKLYQNLESDIREALQDAPQAYIDCRNMLVPERLQHNDGKASDDDDKA